MCRFLQSLAVWLAFAGIFLVPGLARAALLPACEAHDELTRMPAAWLIQEQEAPADASCAPSALEGVTGAAVEDLGDLRVPAMCDARGASMIAPQRILPMTDDRIEAAQGCGVDVGTKVIGPSPKHSPATSSAPALAEHAVLDPAGRVPPPSGELGPAFPPVAGGPRRGVIRGIDHPPR